MNRSFVRKVDIFHDAPPSFLGIGASETVQYEYKETASSALSTVLQLTAFVGVIGAGKIVYDNPRNPDKKALVTWGGVAAGALILDRMI